MSKDTMSFALAEVLRSHVDRRDQQEQAKRRLRELIEEGLSSGSGRRLTRRVAAELKKRALGAPD
ncbi:type II toxin-antitoxin system ParD family antitoxin [Variovorax rhizosphaerae]|uniref:Type II toxin-antitoxin system ParD family antitoxin n=1 Tax=Variovorax rhizosphaerae TaxID=1836200 RepID=A0ABU8WCQ7_9BURK